MGRALLSLGNPAGAYRAAPSVLGLRWGTLIASARRLTGSRNLPAAQLTDRA